VAKKKPELVQSFKGFDQQLACRGFQYEIGKTFEHAGTVKACEAGFHACEYPLDIFNYYAPAGSRFAAVEQSGEIGRHDGDSKVASSRIHIKAELDFAGLIKAALDYTFSRAKPIDPESPASATGYQGAASATGYQGAASATGDQGAASATGVRGAASATGYQGAASATGDQGAASATGDQGAASATGYAGKAMGAEGNALFLVERANDYKIVAVWAGIAGADGIKPLTWYTLQGGKPVEVECETSE
jgi:hypothetical protein